MSQNIPLSFGNCFIINTAKALIREKGLNANKIQRRDSLCAQQQRDHFENEGEEEFRHPVS